MTVYPIDVPRNHYRGTKPALREKAAQYNRDASILEAYLNRRIENDPTPIQDYTYGFVAVDVGLSLERVRNILLGVDGGYHGLTVAKSGEAWVQFHAAE